MDVLLSYLQENKLPPFVFIEGFDLTSETPRVVMVLRNGNLDPARLLFPLQKRKPVEDEQAGTPSFILQGRKHAECSTGAIFFFFF